MVVMVDTSNVTIGLAEALAQPDRQHRHVEWKMDLWLGIVPGGGSELICWAEEPEIFRIPIRVHVEIRKTVWKKTNARVMVDWIAFPYSLQGLSYRTKTHLRNQCKLAIEAATNQRTGPIDIDNLVWDDDARKLGTAIDAWRMAHQVRRG